jgi:hypothetical protein
MLIFSIFDQANTGQPYRQVAFTRTTMFASPRLSPPIKSRHTKLYDLNYKLADSKRRERQKEELIQSILFAELKESMSLGRSEDEKCHSAEGPFTVAIRFDANDIKEDSGSQSRFNRRRKWSL